MICLGRKNGKGRRKELTDFSYLLDKDKKDSDDYEVKQKDDEDK